MNKRIIFKVVLVMLLTVSACLSSQGNTTCQCPECIKKQAAKAQASEVDAVLEQLNKTAGKFQLQPA